MPLTNQLYVGPAPGFTGVAVNVTEAPAQIVPTGFAVIDIDGTSTGLTVIVTLALVTDETLGHAAPLTMVTVTTSPFCKVVDVKVFPVWPGNGFVFKFHW